MKGKGKKMKRRKKERKARKVYDMNEKGRKTEGRRVREGKGRD